MANQISSLSTYCAFLNEYESSISSGECSVLKGGLDSPENKVALSEDARKILRIITLGLSHYLILYVEGNRRESALLDYVKMTEMLLGAIDENMQKINIPLGNGKRVEFTEEVTSKNGYCTVMRETRPGVAHIGTREDKKVYINKTLSQIARTLTVDVLNNKLELSDKFPSLIERATCIKAKMDADAEIVTVAENVKLIYPPTHPMIYKEETIGAELKTIFTQGMYSFAFMTKVKDFLGIIEHGEHKVLGVITPSQKMYVFSAASGKNKHVGNNKEVCYIKLDLEHGAVFKDIYEVYKSIIEHLNDADYSSSTECINMIIDKINPNSALPEIYSGIGKIPALKGR
ncbi:hypothetical protein [Candidatus Symbiopectobacterium sp. NZEC151]|uniref:hypothetical protein n=1 Tax=Candidatus Symbiopectobacterium sp. NZEC151 TaxID=2820470 RepID=UPI0022269812|nr:hypothetical protein [Candidatus Symbiopectobacterium sp. NZEC151]MCW2477075.1 hypothetical protein [Candidatus Symbiopectobacterium sp. NZEC151]